MRSFLRGVLVSFELLAVIVVLVLYQVDDRPFAWVGTSVRSIELWQVTAGFAVLFVFALRQANAVLFPKKGARELMEWRRYSALRSRVIAGLAWVLVGGVIGVTALSGDATIAPAGFGAVFISAAAVSVISVVTLSIAALYVQSLAAGGN